MKTLGKFVSIHMFHHQNYSRDSGVWYWGSMLKVLWLILHWSVLVQYKLY